MEKTNLKKTIKELKNLMKKYKNDYMKKHPLIIVGGAVCISSIHQLLQPFILRTKRFPLKPLQGFR